MTSNMQLPARAQTDPWLMIIDMQRIFADLTSQWATLGYAAASAGIQRMLGRFESRICLTRFLAPDSPTGAWISYYEMWPFALDPVNAPLYELSDEFLSVPAIMVDRTTFGKWDAETDRLLGHPQEILLAGVTTDCCVLSTALCACDAGVHVTVVADACAGLTQNDHQRALDAMALYSPMIDVADVDTVLAPPAT
jgi:nicotinamidase-related amidase